MTVREGGREGEKMGGWRDVERARVIAGTGGWEKGQVV